MKTSYENFEKPPVDKKYINEINWDFLFFRSVTVMGSILVIGMLGYFLWFTQ